MERFYSSDAIKSQIKSDAENQHPVSKLNKFVHFIFKLLILVLAARYAFEREEGFFMITFTFLYTWAVFAFILMLVWLALFTKEGTISRYCASGEVVYLDNGVLNFDYHKSGDSLTHRQSMDMRTVNKLILNTKGQYLEIYGYRKDYCCNFEVAPDDWKHPSHYYDGVGRIRLYLFYADNIKLIDAIKSECIVIMEEVDVLDKKDKFNADTNGVRFEDKGLNGMMGYEK